MKILFLSGWGSALPLAMEMENQGHATRMWIEDKESQDVGDGFIVKLDDYKPSIEWADLVISDDSNLGKISDGLREKGIPVVGGSKMTDALEDDRHLGQKLFKSSGLTCPESTSFKDVEEAIAYIDENPKKYVIKLSGEAQNDKSTTYVGESEDGSDIMPMLKLMAEKFSKGLKSIELQENIDGMEVAVSAFFNGKEFIGPCQVNWEHKKLMPGTSACGWGPNTGEMGTTALWCSKDIELFKKLILPLASPLENMGYHGDFDVNAILAGDGKLYALEMTNRFGWPALPMQLETIKDNDLAEFFLALATGKDFDLHVSNPLSLCVVVGVPPLPYMNDDIFDKYSKDMPVIFKEGAPQDGMYPAECKLEDGSWKVAGTSGCLAVCASGGSDVPECSDRAYELVDQMIVPNKIVRNDIGKFTEESIEQLEEIGLISELEFV